MSVDVLREAARRLARGERVGLATLVATRGSTPQKVGARLVAREGVRLAGTLGGGAVEAAAIGEASQAGAQGPAVREYGLANATDEWGLACGGTMVVLVEPLEPGALGWLERALAAVEGDAPVAVVTAIDGPAAGARLLVDPAGVRGSLGGDAATAEGVALGRKVLDTGIPELARGTTGRLYAEAFGPPPALVILGAGHVGSALSRLGRFLGVRVTVVDDRPEYANPERFPEADSVIARPVPEAVASLPIGAHTAIVVAMRNHDLDYEATGAALRTAAGYVGLVGARRKAILVAERLAAEGFPPERIETLRSPIGLDIGARTPEEIAIAIVGEWIMRRQGGTGTPLQLDPQRLAKAIGRDAPR